jgi:hypothetical protein
MDFGDFVHALKHLHLAVPAAEAKSVFNEVPTNGLGVFLLELLFRNTVS